MLNAYTEVKVGSPGTTKENGFLHHKKVHPIYFPYQSPYYVWGSDNGSLACSNCLRVGPSLSRRSAGPIGLTAGVICDPLRTTRSPRSCVGSYPSPWAPLWTLPFVPGAILRGIVHWLFRDLKGHLHSSFVNDPFSVLNLGRWVPSRAGLVPRGHGRGTNRQNPAPSSACHFFFLLKIPEASARHFDSCNSTVTPCSSMPQLHARVSFGNPSTTSDA